MVSMEIPGSVFKRLRSRVINTSMLLPRKKSFLPHTFESISSRFNTLLGCWHKNSSNSFSRTVNAMVSSLFSSFNMTFRGDSKLFYQSDKPHISSSALCLVSRTCKRTQVNFYVQLNIARNLNSSVSSWMLWPLPRK